MEAFPGQEEKYGSDSLRPHQGSDHLSSSCKRAKTKILWKIQDLSCQRRLRGQHDSPTKTKAVLHKYIWGVNGSHRKRAM